MRAYASLVALLAVGVASVSAYVLPTLAPHPLGGCPKQQRPPDDRHCNFWCLKDDGQYSEDRYEDGLECDFGTAGTGVCYGGLCHSRVSVERYGSGTGKEPSGAPPSPAPEAPPPEVAGPQEVTVIPPSGDENEEELSQAPETPTEKLPTEGQLPTSLPPGEDESSGELPSVTEAPSPNLPTADGQLPSSPPSGDDEGSEELPLPS
uniref:Uncharacterized protein n=1 Tax=Amblyomma triste TaxID=251400 RepID=A0A023GAS1_AMBTT